MRRLFALTGLLAVYVVAAAAQTTPQATPPPDVAAPPADAMKTSSGLAWKIVRPGTGTTHPSSNDLITVQYTGWTTDGAMFDSTSIKGKPATFPLDRVMAGWIEGVQLMVAGEKARFWIPEVLAYKGKREPKGTLVFDIDLISFTQSPLQPPSDVKQAPPDAQKTASGLAYKILTPGIGARHPNSTSSVTVHYSGWTTDGKLFDSSVVRGAPVTFTLDRVIPGWSEGVQLMVEGEKTRLWVPQDLAYKGQSAPYGMLVFDVELVKIN